MTLLTPPPMKHPGSLRYLAQPYPDVDSWVGVYQVPTDALLGLNPPRARDDYASGFAYTLYELGHFARMLAHRADAVVDWLYIPDDRVAKSCPMIGLLRLRRDAIREGEATEYISDLLVRSRKGEFGGNR